MQQKPFIGRALPGSAGRGDSQCPHRLYMDLGRGPLDVALEGTKGRRGKGGSTGKRREEEVGKWGRTRRDKWTRFYTGISIFLIPALLMLRLNVESGRHLQVH